MAIDVKSDEVGRFVELVHEIEAINAKTSPLQEDLDIINIQINTLRAKSHEIADKIATHRGGQYWLDIKAEMASLAHRGAARAANIAFPVRKIQQPSLVKVVEPPIVYLSIWNKIKAFFS